MANSFDVNMRLLVQGPPSGARGVVSDLQRSLQGTRLSVPVEVNGRGQAAAALSNIRTEAAATATTLTGTVRVLGQAETALSNFGSQAGLAARRFLAFTAAAGSIVQLVGMVKQGVSAAIDFELQMNRVAQVSGETADQIKAIRQEIGALSTSLGVSSAELAKVAVSLKQAGLSAGEVKDALRAVALTDLAPNFDSMAQTTEGLIAVMRQFNVDAKSFTSVLGSMNAVAGEFAVEADDLVTAVQKAGGAFAAVAGQTKEPIRALAEFQGLFTAVRATTRESADSIATGLRTIFTRLQRADTVDALKEFGIQLRYTRDEAKALGDVDLENQFVGAYEAVKRLSEGLASLRPTDPRFSAIAEQLGGYRQISRVLPLIQQQETAQKAVNVALAGQISLDIAAEKRQESLANRVSKVKEEYLELFRKVAESDGFQGLAKSAADAASSIAKILDAARPLLPVLLAIGASRAIAGGVGFVRSASDAFFSHVGATSRQVQSGPSTPPRRFARGGVVPGIGDSDSVPAYLMPGEFVVRKSSAQAIGYDALHQMNEGGMSRRRYAGGGLARKYPTLGRLPLAARPADLTSLLTGLDDLYESGRVDGLPGRHIEKISATLTPEALARVPAGSRLLGLGSVGVAFAAPEGDVIRLQSQRVVRSEIARRAARGQGTTPGLFGTERPDIRAMLQATHAESLGDVFAERLPLGTPVTGELTRAVVRDKLKALARADGYEFTDTHSGNFASFGGTPLIIDPGAVRPLRPSLDDPDATRSRQSARGFSSGGPSRFARGGPSGDDTIPALLTPGEFVMRREAVSRIGADELDHMNRYGRPRRYHRGGYVAMLETGGDPAAAPTVDLSSPVDARTAAFVQALDRLTKTIVRIEREIQQGAGAPTARGELAATRARAAEVRRQLGLEDDPSLAAAAPTSTLVRVTKRREVEAEPAAVPSPVLTPAASPANDARAAFREAYRNARSGELGAVSSRNRQSLVAEALASFASSRPAPEVSPPAVQVSPTPAPTSPVSRDPLARFRRLLPGGGVPSAAEQRAGTLLTDRDAIHRFQAEPEAPDLPPPQSAPAARPKLPPLSPAQQKFLNENLEAADKYAAKLYRVQVAKGLDVGNRAESDVQAASLDSLIGVVSKIGTEGFDPKKARGALFSSIARNVLGKQGVLTNLYPEGAPTVNLGENDVAVHQGGDNRPAGGLDDAQRKRFELLSGRLRSVLGPLPTGLTVPGEKGYADLQQLVKASGQKASGTADQLTEKLAQSARGQLFLPDVGGALGERFTRALPQPDTRAVTQSGLADLGRQLGLSTREFADLSKEARNAARQMGVLNDYLDGMTKVVIRTRDGFSKVVGFGEQSPLLGPSFVTRDNARAGGQTFLFGDGQTFGRRPGRGQRQPYGGPLTPSIGLAATDPDAVRYQEQVVSALTAISDLKEERRQGRQGAQFERQLSAAQDAVRGQRREANRVTDPLALAQDAVDPLSRFRSPGYAAQLRERAAQRQFQDASLAAARERFGSTFGVPGDELASNRRLGRGQAAGDIQAFEFDLRQRAENRSFVDPLIVARDTRQQRLDESRAKERQENAARLAEEARISSVLRDRAARDAEGVTDPLQLKQNALRAFQSGQGGFDVLDSVRGRLSPAQFGQVEAAARRAGFDRPTFRVSGVDTNGLDQNVRVQAQTQAEAEAIAKARGLFVTGSTQGSARGSGRPAAGELLALRDDEGRLVGGSIQQNAARAADRRFTELGGRASLSQQTKDQVAARILAEEEGRTRRELVSAQQRLVKALNPSISEVEATRLAVEQANEAMLGLAKVSRDASGKLLGLQTSVQEANTRGVTAPGAAPGVVAPTLRERGASLAENIRNSRFGRFTSALDDGRFGQFAQSPSALIAASVALPLAVNGLESLGGTADKVVAGGASEGRFRGTRGASGALQGAFAGAAVGGAIGSVIPGVGTVVGGAVGGAAGALAGFVSALHDAEKEIRQVKLNNALTSFADRVQTLAATGGANDPSFASDALRNLRVAREAGRDKAIADSTDLFGRLDSQQFFDLSRKGLRQDFGGQLPQLSGYLQAQAQSLAKANPGEAADKLAARLREGGDGLNHEFATIIAGIRGVSVDKVFKELTQDIVRSQQSQSASARQRAGAAVQEQSVNTFGRLVLALQAATDSLTKFRQSAQVTADLLDGSVSATRVTAGGEALNQLGRQDGGALAPLGVVRAVGGETGRRLYDTGASVDAAAAALPGILAEVTSSARGTADGDDIIKEVTARLRKQLGNRPGSTDVITAVQGRLSEETSTDRGGVGNLFSQVRVDSTALSQRLLEPLSGPVQKAGQEAARLIEENANLIGEALAQAAVRLRQAGETRDQAGFIRQNAARTSAEFAADRAGRRGQAIDRLSLDQLESGFLGQQRRLGATVANPFQAASIGTRLNAVGTELRSASERQQEVFARTGGAGREYQEAAEKVVRLKVEAANLQQALKNLADSSARTAAAQEKLARLAQEQDSRLGLAERYATADAGERSRLDRGLLLANQANNGRGLDTFSADDRRLLLEVLRSAGGSTLTGFNGAPRADDLYRRLLTQFGGGAFALNKGQQAEQERLRGVVEARNQEAGKAADTLAGFQENETGRFLSDLARSQDQFLKRLEAILAGERLTAVNNGLGEVSARRQDLQGKMAGKDLLAGLGLTDDARLSAAANLRPELEKYRSGLSQRKQAEDKLKAAADGASKYNYKFDDFLQKYGLNDDPILAQRLANRFTAKVDETRAAGGYSGKSAADKLAIDRDLLRKALQDESRYDGNGSLFAEPNKQIREARRRLSGVPGLNLDALDSTLSDDKKSSALFKAFDDLKGADALKRLDDDLKSLADRRKSLEAERDRIAEVYKNLAQAGNAPAAAPAPALVPPTAPAPAPAPPPAPSNPYVDINRTRRFASGGSVDSHPGGPSGTDTVPAWLSPGEFVVNARSAQANLSLLTRLNSGGGALMLAGGGSVDPFGRAGLALAQRQAYDRQVGNFFTRERHAAGWMAADRAAYSLAFAGQVGAVNARSLLSSLPARPGEEGQLAIAAADYQRRQDARAQAARENLSVQRAIAARAAGRGMSRGGAVHLAGGGSVGSSSGGFPASDATTYSRLSEAVTSFGPAAGGLSSALGQFAHSANLFSGAANALAKAIESMPRSISLQGQHTMTVNLNGADALAAVTPQLRSLVVGEVSRVLREQIPDAGVRLH